MEDRKERGGGKTTCDDYERTTWNAMVGTYNMVRMSCAVKGTPVAFSILTCAGRNGR